MLELLAELLSPPEIFEREALKFNPPPPPPPPRPPPIIPLQSPLITIEEDEGILLILFSVVAKLSKVAKKF